MITIYPLLPIDATSAVGQQRITRVTVTRDLRAGADLIEWRNLIVGSRCIEGLDRWIHAGFRLLLALSRLGSMRAVADSSNMTTSTVSQQIAALARKPRPR